MIVKVSIANSHIMARIISTWCDFIFLLVASINGSMNTIEIVIIIENMIAVPVGIEIVK